MQKNIFQVKHKNLLREESRTIKYKYLGILFRIFIVIEVENELFLNERTSIKDVEERFIVTVACKAAVKANMD